MRKLLKSHEPDSNAWRGPPWPPRKPPPAGRFFIEQSRPSVAPLRPTVTRDSGRAMAVTPRATIAGRVWLAGDHLGCGRASECRCGPAGARDSESATDSDRPGKRDLPELQPKLYRDRHGDQPESRRLGLSCSTVPWHGPCSRRPAATQAHWQARAH